LGNHSIFNKELYKKTGKKEKEKSFAVNAKNLEFQTVQTSDFLGSDRKSVV
jgi:hypothetical protein